MGDLLKQLRSPGCDGTVPCWTAEEAARQIETLQAQLQSEKARADAAEARLAALEAGMRGLVEEWRGESHYTLSFRCGMQLAADELSALLNRPADGGE